MITSLVNEIEPLQKSSLWLRKTKFSIFDMWKLCIPCGLNYSETKEISQFATI